MAKRNDTTKEPTTSTPAPQGLPAAAPPPTGRSDGAVWSFADAMAMMIHEGRKVKRTCWGGCLAVYVEAEGQAAVLVRLPDGPAPWVPSQEDMSATDWTIAEQ